MRVLFFFVLTLLAPAVAQAGHVLSVGAGWENMGISPQTTWKPYEPLHTQGSRKEAQAYASWSWIGTQRVYWAPMAKLKYGADWSLAGAMNLLELAVGPGALGVYVTQPVSAYAREDRRGKWFAAFELVAGSFHFGANLTPNRGVFSEGVREWTDFDRQTGNQYYAFGHPYYYFQFSTPLTFRFWTMLTNDVGLGMHVASDVMVLEKSLDRPNMPLAVGYNIHAGFGVYLF